MHMVVVPLFDTWSKPPLTLLRAREGPKMGCLGLSARGLAGVPGAPLACEPEGWPRPAGTKPWNDPRTLSRASGTRPPSLCSPDRENRRPFGGGRSDHCVALRDHCQRPGPIRLGRGGRPEVRACAGSALVGLQVTASGHNVPSSGAARGVYGGGDKWSSIAFSRSLLAPRRPD